MAANRARAPATEQPDVSRAMRGAPGGGFECAAPRDLLSLREAEIADLVARGFSNKEIALDLKISHWTVSTHLRRVFAKLDIKSRVDLCRLVVTAERRPGSEEVRAAPRAARTAG